MADIRILRNTVCGGKWVKAGEEVVASDQDAHILVTMGKAERLAAAPAATAPAASTGEAASEDRAVRPASRRTSKP